MGEFGNGFIGGTLFGVALASLLHGIVLLIKSKLDERREELLRAIRDASRGQA